MIEKKNICVAWTEILMINFYIKIFSSENKTNLNACYIYVSLFHIYSSNVFLIVLYRNSIYDIIHIEKISHAMGC